MDSMPFNLGFQIKHVLNPWNMHINPVKVSLNGFAISFKIPSAYCVLFPPTIVKKMISKLLDKIEPELDIG